VPASDSVPYSHSHSSDSVTEMVTTAASATVSNVVGMIRTKASLSVQNAAMKVQWCDLLPSPHLSPRHPFLLTASTSSTRQTHRPSPQCRVSLCDGLAGYAIPLYNSLAVQKPTAGSPEPVRAPGSLDPSTLTESEPARIGLQTMRAMLIVVWPALLAALFLLITNLSDPVFGNVLGALQVFASTAGWLALPALRDAFLTVLAKAALPPRVVAALD